MRNSRGRKKKKSRRRRGRRAKVKEEHALRNTTSIDDKISRARRERQVAVPEAEAPDIDDAAAEDKRERLEYGDQAGGATQDGLHAAGHAIGTAWAVFKIRKAPKLQLKQQQERQKNQTRNKVNMAEHSPVVSVNFCGVLWT
ncbi:hypothetical protein EJ110_NYTH26179 [Nymphaea thermarum]|nr:hypothetical protein EJ110_NYTH26179 [Nymphaea thermarum]